MSLFAYKYDVTLVTMPFLRPNYSPLGLEIISNEIRQCGYKVRKIYANIDFAETLPQGLFKYLFDFQIDPEQILLDAYLFADILWGNNESRDQNYINYLKNEDNIGRIGYDGDTITKLKDLLDILPILRINCQRLIDSTIASILSEPTKIVAVSSSFNQRFASLALLRELKRNAPHITTFMGGADCEGIVGIQTIITFDFIDFVFSGEGEVIVPEMVQRIIHNEKINCSLPLGVFDRPKALNSLAQDPPVIECATVLPEEIGNPDYKDFYEHFNNSSLPVNLNGICICETSRGCWKGEKAHCSFCGLNGLRIHYRRKRLDNVEKQIWDSYNNHNIRLFYLADTIIDLPYLRPLLHKFGQTLHDAAISVEIPSTFGEEQILELAECGVLFIQPGIESLHPRHLELLNKSNSAINNIALLKYSEENNVDAGWNLLVKIPGDTKEEYDELISLLPKLTHLPAPSVNAIRYDRFSEYHTYSNAYGLKLTALESMSILLPYSPTEIDNLSFYFVNLNPDITVPTETIEPVKNFCDRWAIEKVKHKTTLQFCEDGISIHDTRPIRQWEEYTKLTDEEIQLLTWARHPRKEEERLKTNFSKDSWDNMLHKSFLVCWDKHYLALPLIMNERTMESSHLRYASIDV